MTAITVRLTPEEHDWLRKRSFFSRLSQAGIIAAAMDIARYGDDSIIRRAAVALREAYGDRTFRQDDAASLFDLHWLGDRPNLWIELHALRLIEVARGAEGDRPLLWKGAWLRVSR